MKNLVFLFVLILNYSHSYESGNDKQVCYFDFLHELHVLVYYVQLFKQEHLLISQAYSIVFESLLPAANLKTVLLPDVSDACLEL